MNDRAISFALSLRADPYPNPDYRVCRTESDIRDYIGNTPRILVAQDTESLPTGQPYCLTFSNAPGTGRLIYRHDAGLVYLYGRILEELQPHQLFHNYLHDVIPFTALSLPIHKFTDTMVRAYHLCLGGGGDDEDSESKAGRGSLSLKMLAYRHCNMQMTSFRDTVYPHSIPYLANWLSTAATALTPLPKVKMCICGHRSDDHERHGKTQRCTGPCPFCDCRKHKSGKPAKPSESDKELASLYTKSNRLATRLLTETDTDWADTKKDPWKFIRTNWADDMPTLELFSGPIPAPSIAHVPEPELLQYACRDADATLRLYLHMRHLKPWLFYP